MMHLLNLPFGAGRRTRVFFLAGLAFCAPAAIGAVLGLTHPAFGSEESLPAGSEIVIDNFSFGPGTVTVPAGTTVTWVNRDDTPHSVVDDADAKQFKSSGLDTDETFSHRFDQPGVFKYFCSLHPKMQGVVVVK